MTTPARAFAFDMDGTIVDNMDFHTQSWVTFFERRGKTIDADAFFRATAGRHGREIIRDYLGQHLSEAQGVAATDRTAPRVAGMPGKKAASLVADVRLGGVVGRGVRVHAGLNVR